MCAAALHIDTASALPGKMVHNRPTATPTMRPTGSRGPPQRQRPKIAAMETGPGPTKYCLPGTCGSLRHDPSRRQGPSFSFGTKTKQASSMYVARNSPGPVHYVAPSVTRTGREGTPAYSVYGRPKTLERVKSPGPAAYNIRNTHPPREHNAPAYSMGKRLVFGSRSSTPAPNVYSLPTLVGSHIVARKSTPAYSLSGRPKLGGFDEDTKKTPGPGTYQVVEPAAVPAFSMTGRNFPPSGQKLPTGPADYSPEKVNPRAAPSFSFGVKHSEYIASYLEMVV